MSDFSQKVKNLAPGHTWLIYAGQAGFIIKSASGSLLGIDLYLSDCVERVENDPVGYKRLLPRPFAPDELVFDCLIATHFHRDHFDVDAMPALMKNGRTKLLAAWDCLEEAKEFQNVGYVAPGTSIACGDFSLSFVPCDHGAGAPLAVGAVVNVDGKTIYEAGDTCLHLEWADALPEDINVLIAPINGAYGNLNEEECALYSRALKPRLTIPCHYGMFKAHGGNPDLFCNYMNSLCPENEYLVMNQGDAIKL